MLRIILVGFCLALVGCAVPATPVTGPDGHQAYVLKCSGYMRDRQDCLIKAGQLCPTGYSVVDDNSSTNGAIVTGSTVIIAKREYLTISCK